MRTISGGRVRTLASAAIIVVATGVGASLSHGAAWIAPQSAAPTASGLSPYAQRVVDYLLQDWAKRFRSTSIPLAMANLEIPPNDALRLEVLAYFQQHTELADNLTWWGPNN